MTTNSTRRPGRDVVLEASTVGLSLVVRSLASALEVVTLQQYRILVLIVTRGPMRSGDLAAELGLLPSSITRIVDRLVRDGFVAKRAGSQDGREVVVTAEAPATELVEQVLSARQREFRAVLRRMTPEERTAVRAAAVALTRTVRAGSTLDAEIMLAVDREDRGGSPATAP